MQLGFYYDQSRCIGCQTCRVACKDWKDVPDGPVALRRVLTLEEGQFPKISVRFFSLSCLHCAAPPCIPVCPGQAITKRERDGIVTVAEERCLPGCRACLHACPFAVPQFADEKAPMRVCDLCLDRWMQNQKPVCVLACPQRALDAGPMEELKRSYAGESAMRSFPGSESAAPSLLFKPKSDTLRWRVSG